MASVTEDIILDQVNGDNDKQDSCTLQISDGEDSAASLFDSFMEIAKTAELQISSNGSEDVAVATGNNKYCVSDRNDAVTVNTAVVGSTENELKDISSSENMKIIENSDHQAINCSPNEKQNETVESIDSVNENAINVPTVSSNSSDTGCMLRPVESKKNNVEDISYRLSRTLDNLDILEQQLFNFMQTQTEQYREKKDCVMKSTPNFSNNEGTTNHDIADKNTKLSGSPENDESTVSVQSVPLNEKEGVLQSQSSNHLQMDVNSINYEMEFNSVESEKNKSENNNGQQEGSKLENVAKTQENHGNCSNIQMHDNIEEEMFKHFDETVILEEKEILDKTENHEQKKDFVLDCETKNTEICSEVVESVSESAASKGSVVEEVPGTQQQETCQSHVKNLTELETPGIELELIDESGVSKQKSVVDSSDINHSPTTSSPGSPVPSDEGHDSDSHSDIAEEETFDKRKSWYLEPGHFKERSNSESSTVSEREYRLSLQKSGDNAVGSLSEGDFIRGHLLKLGGSGFTPRNWRKRWCILKKDSCLYYYKTSKEKIPSGVVVLSNYSVSKALEVNKKYCFKLNKGGARTYYFCAADENGMRQWMMALMDAAQRSSEKGANLQISEGCVHNVSIPALSIQDPDCHGYLLKHGLSILSWKRRYCVLKNGYLYYYSDMANTMALGVAKLIGYSIEIGEHHGSRYCFRAIPPSAEERIYLFAADTETDRKRWMARLESSIQKAKGGAL